MVVCRSPHGPLLAWRLVGRFYSVQSHISRGGTSRANATVAAVAILDCLGPRAEASKANTTAWTQGLDNRRRMISTIEVRIASVKSNHGCAACRKGYRAGAVLIGNVRGGGEAEGE